MVAPVGNAVQYIAQVFQRGSIHFADTLMAEANAQNAFSRPIFAHQILHNTRFGGDARPRREHNFIVLPDGIQRDFIVPE